MFKKNIHKIKIRSSLNKRGIPIYRFGQTNAERRYKLMILNNFKRKLISNKNFFFYRGVMTPLSVLEVKINALEYDVYSDEYLNAVYGSGYI